MLKLQIYFFFVERIKSSLESSTDFNDGRHQISEQKMIKKIGGKLH